MSCQFNEPWVGTCKKPRTTAYCCEEHSKEKCQVCGQQALTRCQASIGLMCGIPLCQNCGSGEMCIFHAVEGPLMVVRALLGGGPVPSTFGTFPDYKRQADEMKMAIERLQKQGVRLTMAWFDEKYAWYLAKQEKKSV